MKLSEQIITQAERYERTRAFSLSHPYKIELSNIHKELFGAGVNTSCNTCVASALSKVYQEYKKQEIPKVKKEDIEVSNSREAKEEDNFEEPVYKFTGVKQYERKELKPMKVAELRKIAEELNIEIDGKPNKAELIKLIINQ